MNNLDPKVEELIKEQREAEARAEELRNQRNTWIVKLKEKGFSYKQLSIYFKITRRRIRDIIKKKKGG